MDIILIQGNSGQAYRMGDFKWRKLDSMHFYVDCTDFAELLFHMQIHYIFKSLNIIYTYFSTVRTEPFTIRYVPDYRVLTVSVALGITFIAQEHLQYINTFTCAYIRAIMGS